MNLLQLVNSEAGRYLLGKLGQKPEYPIIGITKNSFTEKLDKRTNRATFFPAQPILALFDPILTKIKLANEYKRIIDKQEAFLHFSGLETKNYKYPQVFLAESTFNPAVGANSPVNGEVGSGDAGDDTFANIRGAAGGQSTVDTSTQPAMQLQSTGTTNQFGAMKRGVFLFNTSSLGVGATITVATFSVYVTGKTDQLSQSVGITSSSPASNSNLVNSDFAVANFGSTRFATDITIANITLNAFNDWTLNADGRNNISLTGISKFGVRGSGDIDNSAPTWSASQTANVTAHWAGEANKPKLVVTYTSAEKGYAFVI